MNPTRDRRQKHAKMSPNLSDCAVNNGGSFHLMKKTFLGVLILGCLAGMLAAQSHTSVITFGLVRTIGDKTLTGTAVIRGKQVTTEGAVIRCSGGCEFRHDFVVLQADDLAYDQNTGVAKVRGKVSMQVAGVKPTQHAK